MKGQLAKITTNKVVSRVTGEIGKFYLAHESTILTGGTIGFSMATTAVTYRNADRIKAILSDASYILQEAKDNGNQEEVKKVYADTLKRLAPLIAPIVIFQAATIATACVSKKRSDKKLAEAAGALSIAQAAISQYQSWQKDTEEALGEKKYEKLQSDIYKNKEVDGRLFSDTPLEGAPGEVLIIDKYSGRPFWSHTSKVENAANELGRMLYAGGADQVTINDFYDLIGNNNLTPNELGERFGYIADMGYDMAGDITARFADTHYVFPNGTKIPAFELYLWPEPDYVG